jgi:phosphotransferase system enzyme I (PtsP)
MEDAYLRERASDIRDLGRRIVTHIQSDRPTPRPAYSSTVLVGKEISVGQLAEIPVEHLAGIVSTSGSSSSHVAILAQALGPAVMGGERDQTLIADGYRGEVFVRP